MMQEQCDNCTKISSKLINATDNNPNFIWKTAETKSHLYDPQRKQQSSTSKTPSSLTATNQLLHVQQHITKHGTVVHPPSPYSSDLILQKFSLFPWMKTQQKGCYFTAAVEGQVEYLTGILQ
jgi:hypothetical protein